jgi:phosphomannomutase
MAEAFSPEIQARIDKWLKPDYDEETRSAIRTLQQQDPKSLIDAFYTDLSFGTGGMRGIMGVGTNRLNDYTIRQATQGLANYILKQTKKGETPSVFISFDSRHHSAAFARQAALVLAGNGIAVFLTKELRPTPYVSFGVRTKKCIAGIMITASHNPAKYNGYKVYWSDGAQVTEPHDTGIIEEVHAIKELSQIRLAKSDTPLISLVDEKMDTTYLEAIRPLQFFPEENQKSGAQLKIAYTSLHGTGITLAPLALKDWGFNTIHYVSEQIKPDGDFPTTPFPNPEFKEALQLGIDLLVKSESDLLLANDPDADRLGIVVRHKGEAVILSGNEVAAVSVYYLCKTLTARGKMPANGAFVTTIVSTELQKEIAKAYNKPCFEVLTGFKYIGEKIHEWESSKSGFHFLFGAEESYGYLIGTHSRDKDAIVTSCFLSEMALHTKMQGQTLVDMLHEIYHTFGIFREKQLSLSFEATKAGADQMQNLMNKLRKNPPTTFLGQPVILFEDYETRERHDLLTGQKTALTLPKSDVLLFRLKDQTKLIIRPSGTEPKVKLYGAVREKEIPKNEEEIKKALAAADVRVETFLKDAKAELLR